MFIVRTGQVFVPVLDENGKQQFLVQLSARHIFGEMALLTGEPRTADVVAGSDCSCITIPRETLLPLLARELELLNLGSKIQKEVTNSISKTQREYFLREQLKAIQKELGEVDDRQVCPVKRADRVVPPNLPMVATRMIRPHHSH
jgi:CRP-like cAMP-binding protein